MPTKSGNIWCDMSIDAATDGNPGIRVLRRGFGGWARRRCLPRPEGAPGLVSRPAGSSVRSIPFSAGRYRRGERRSPAVRSRGTRCTTSLSRAGCTESPTIWSAYTASPNSLRLPSVFKAPTRAVSPSRQPSGPKSSASGALARLRYQVASRRSSTSPHRTFCFLVLRVAPPAEELSPRGARPEWIAPSSRMSPRRPTGSEPRLAATLEGTRAIRPACRRTEPFRPQSGRHPPSSASVSETSSPFGWSRRSHGASTRRAGIIRSPSKTKASL